MYCLKLKNISQEQHDLLFNFFNHWPEVGFDWDAQVEVSPQNTDEIRESETDIGQGVHIEIEQETEESQCVPAAEHNNDIQPTAGGEEVPVDPNSCKFCFCNPYIDQSTLVDCESSETS